MLGRFIELLSIFGVIRSSSSTGASGSCPILSGCQNAPPLQWRSQGWTPGVPLTMGLSMTTVVHPWPIPGQGIIFYRDPTTSYGCTILGQTLAFVNSTKPAMWIFRHPKLDDICCIGHVPYASYHPHLPSYQTRSVLTPPPFTPLWDCPLQKMFICCMETGRVLLYPSSEHARIAYVNSSDWLILPSFAAWLLPNTSTKHHYIHHDHYHQH